MDEQEMIIKVVRRLVGETSPIGETYHDSQALCNICVYMGVVDQLIMYIIDDATLMSDYMKSLASVQNCRKAILEGLKKINERIEECLEEEEVE